MSAINLNEAGGATRGVMPVGGTPGALQRSARWAVPAALRRIVDTLCVWTRRVRQRQQLQAALGHDAHIFQDIGVSRATVYNEASKWFWQA